jgi:hypothetical protein
MGYSSNSKMANDQSWILKKVSELSEKLKVPSELKRYIYVFGGCPRDLLRGTNPRDLDVRVPTFAVAEALLKSLLATRQLLEVKKTITMDYPGVSPTEYICYTLVIKTPSTQRLEVDISYSMATSVAIDSMGFCDFTCNNITMSLDGEISTRIKPWQIGLGEEFTEAEWTVKCIRDCIKGELVWMIPNRFTESMGANDASCSAFMEKMLQRLQKMLRKGFVLAGEEERYLTSFRLVE